MSRIGNSMTAPLLREISQNRVQMADLQRQIASGKKSTTYGGLGTDRSMSLSLRSEMQQIEGFRNSISVAGTRVKVMSTVVNHIRDHAVDTRSQMMIAGFEPMSTGQTLAQGQAKARLADVVDMLNTEVGGRFLFAGTKTDEPPVRPPAEIMDGTGTKAGFRQIMNERAQADLGADGKGRLVLAAPDAVTTSLGEDVAGSPFGFKLGGASTDMAGVTLAGPAGSPAKIDVGFGNPLPQNGQTIKLTLNLPDGTSKDLTLTAKSGSQIGEGEFAIGADAGATSTNFKNALSSLIAKEAKTTLSASSMQAAANDFFKSGSDPVQRVDGPPFDSATGLRNATPDDTVEWYTGDRSSVSARESSIARVDDNQLVAYGARADEEAFGTMMKQLAVMSAATFDASDDTAYEKYAAMTQRVSGNLGNSVKSQSLDRVIGELAIAQSSLSNADERHVTADNMITGFLSEIETADLNEAGAKLLGMQTQLQASYQVTSMLSKLSLVNYM